MKAEAESLRARFKGISPSRGFPLPSAQHYSRTPDQDSSHFNAEDLITVFRKKDSGQSCNSVQDHLSSCGCRFLLPVALESSQAYYEFALTLPITNIWCARNAAG